VPLSLVEMRLTLFAVCSLMVLYPRAVAAQVAVVDGDTRWPTTAPEADKAGEGDATEPYEPIGLGVDVGVGSAYGFRGLNLLQEKSQHDQRFVLQPSISYEVPNTGLNISYFSSYQVSGENRRALVDAGVGDEQDLLLAFSKEVHELLSIGTGVAAYTYPFASREAAGTAFPLYVEPSVSATLSYELDLTFATSFLAGVGDELFSGSYLYLNPRVSKTFEIVEGISLTAAVGYGAKLQEGPDNVHDVAVDVGASFEPSTFFYIRPGIHWAWTNLDKVGFADEQFGWVSTNIGTAL
jgi:hypothetical protein